MSAPDPGPRLDWQVATIQRLERQTPRAVSVFLGATLASHEAGQYLDVRLTAADGYQAQRSYSIASAPGSVPLELVVERMAQGEVSPWFHDVARPGDDVEVRGPIGGHFVWRPADGGPLVLVAGGSGIAPLMSMARHRAVTAPSTPALLVCAARTWQEVVFRAELLDLAAADAAFGLVFALSRGEKHRSADIEGRLDRRRLRGILAGWGHAPRRAYVCGSTPFVEAMTTALMQEGVASGIIRAERFGGSA